MSDRLVLASGSRIRQQLLRNAGVDFEVKVARIDEAAISASLRAEGATPRDVADALAEFKALRVAEKDPGALVIGCDQVLEVNGEVLSKPTSIDDARAQLLKLRGTSHRLLSAAVIYGEGKPLWRHVGQVRLQMRVFSDEYLEEYLARNWPGIKNSVGAYKLEEEGVRLFSQVQGDYFSVLGLPLIELLSYLTLRGALKS